MRCDERLCVQDIAVSEIDHLCDFRIIDGCRRREGIDCDIADIGLHRRSQFEERPTSLFCGTLYCCFARRHVARVGRRESADAWAKSLTRGAREVAERAISPILHLLWAPAWTESLLTRAVYMDESGTSKFEPHLVVAAVIVHADRQLDRLELRLSELVEKHIEPQYRDGFVFHASSLFNPWPGEGEFPPGLRDDRERRLGILEELTSIPAELRLPVCVGYVEKHRFSQIYLAAGIEVSS